MGKSVVGFLCAVICLAGCSGGTGKPGRIVLTLTVAGLPELAPGEGHYEGWGVDRGVARSTGKFRIDASVTPARVVSLSGSRVYGTVNGAVFGPSVTGIGDQFPFIWRSTEFFITLEAEGDTNRIPSDAVLLRGPIVGEGAALSPAFLQSGDLTLATGVAVLASPTDGSAPDSAGVWFINQAPPGEMPGLSLPPLQGSFTYEGWVLLAGQTLSTGRFLDPTFRDLDAAVALTRGSDNPGFVAPGQDFTRSATLGAATALDLASGEWSVVVTLEPFPDTSPLPSGFPVLRGDIGTNLVNGDFVASGEGVASPLATPVALNAQIAPTSVAFSGTSPGSLGSIVPLTDPRDGHYACWATRLGTPELLGRYVIDEFGQAFATATGMPIGNLAAFTLDPIVTGLGVAFPDATLATDVFITIEPQAPDAIPSPHVALRGDVIGGAATLAFDGFSDPQATFTAAASVFTLRTPTNDDGTNPADDHRGLWFVDGGRDFSLRTPLLQSQWNYEAWVVNNVTSEKVSLGTFRLPFQPDDDAASFPGRGTVSLGFDAPGQDFLNTVAGEAVVAPLDLTTGATVLVTLEPLARTSSVPSSFVVLSGVAPASALTPFPLTNVANVGFTGSIAFDR